MQPRDEPTQTTPTVALSQRNSRASVFDPERRTIESLLVSRAEFARGVVTRTCPQCGLNHADTHVEVSVEYVPPWIFLTLFAHVLVLAICYYAARKRVETSVMMCADCGRSARRARALRIGATASLVLVNGLAPVALVFAESTVAVLAAGAAMVASWVGAGVIFRRTRADRVGAGAIDDHTVTLKVPTSWRRVLREEAPALLDGRRAPRESLPSDLQAPQWQQREPDDVHVTAAKADELP